MDIAAAVDTLRDWCAASEEPVLGDDELLRIIARARRVDAAGNVPDNVATTSDHATSTAVTAGTIVQQPGARRWWQAANAGTTGAVAPPWPVFTTEPATGQWLYDGTVWWRDLGGEWHPTYDLHAAAAEAWSIKAGRAANKFSFTTDGQNFQRQQIAARCLEMAAYYRRKRGATTIDLKQC